MGKQGGWLFGGNFLLPGPHEGQNRLGDVGIRVTAGTARNAGHCLKLNLT